MTVNLPALDFSPANVGANRDAIVAARAALKAMATALEGLHKANVSLCPHQNKQKRYDPGYAGGGYSHSECPDCGGQLP